MPYQFTFILPHETNLPIGGYKVVYEFANELVGRGHSATVVLPKMMQARTGVVGEIKSFLWPRIHKLRNPNGITWFKLDPKVEVILCSDLREKWLPKSDFVIATSFRTAPHVVDYSNRLGKKLYLIQQIETWGGSDADVIATWKMPLHKLVIARWLAEFAESIGESYSEIKLGVDFNHFGIDTPIPNRGHAVSMLYHDSYVKASWDGINAIELAREKFPDLTATLFGTPSRPYGLPSWIEYVHNGSASQLREIYNRSSVFVHPSWAEGWPMPPAEAMACGAAVIAAANPGIMDYLKPNVTGLTSRPKYWTELADNLIALLSDEPRRIEIANAGNADIAQYTWERATNSFLEAVK